MALLIAFASILPTVPVAVNAATANPQSLEELFDAQFYALKYPDVASAIGNDEKALFEHFVEHGINEGRTCSPYLNVAQYRANYPDVAITLDHHWDDIVKHYFTYGIKEGRKSFVSPEDIAIQNALLSSGDNGSQTSEAIEEDIELGSNSNIILESINNAIFDATNSSTGYFQDADTGIVASADGYVIIPFDIIEEEGRIKDIDELAKRCGSDLVLIRDNYGRIKFVGGRFSNVVVNDENTALQALDTMVDLYGFDVSKNYLQLSTTGMDSLGNPFYRFVSIENADGSVNSNYTVTLSTDKNGNVLAASNTTIASLSQKSKIKAYIDEWDGKEDFENPESGIKKLNSEAKLVYDDETKKYYWANYYESEQDGLVAEILIDAEGKNGYVARKIYDAKTFYNNPSQSFTDDYRFMNLSNATEKTFIDYFGNAVKLPVAYEKGKGWYIVDTTRKMLCIQSSGDDEGVNASDCDNHYFSDEYFNAVDRYIEGDTVTSLLLEKEKVIISAFTTIQMAYDENRALGMLEKPKTIYLNYKYDDDSDNASHATYCGIIDFCVNNNRGNVDFAGMAHEFGHAVVANQGQRIPYEAATGAINESYADIIGSLLKMIKKQEGRYSGHVDYDKWLIGEFLGNNTEHVIRNLSDPFSNKEGPAPVQINDDYFIKDTGDYESTDHGGVHQNSSILSHICYRMYDEVFAAKDKEGKSIPDQNKYRDLLKVWYDSVIYLNHDSTYADVKGYILQAMKNHGYSSDLIAQTEQIFNDAKVDDYKPFDGEAQKASNYDQTDLEAAAKLRAKTGGNELSNLIKGKMAADDAELDYEIAYDELKLAKLKGLSGEELKSYENDLEIAHNKLSLSENNVEELENAFDESQVRLKKMVDSKMDIIRKQENALKQLEKDMETNPNLERAYRTLRRALKNNISHVDGLIDAVEEAAIDFKGLNEIEDVFLDVWDIDADALIDDEELGYPDDMPADLYIIDEEYPEGLSAWDYYDYWDEFWEEYWEADEDDDWYGNDQEWDPSYNYYDENYSDEDYFGSWDSDDWDDYEYPDDESDDLGSKALQETGSGSKNKGDSNSDSSASEETDDAVG